MTPAYYSIVSNNTEVLARRRCHGWRRLMMMMLCVVCARLMAGASYIPTPTSTSLLVHIYIGIHSTFIGRISMRTDRERESKDRVACGGRWEPPDARPEPPSSLPLPTDGPCRHGPYGLRTDIDTGAAPTGLLLMQRSFCGNKYRKLSDLGDLSN